MNKVIPDSEDMEIAVSYNGSETSEVEDVERSSNLPNGSAGTKRSKKLATISYHDLSYEVKLPGCCCNRGKKQILFSLSGVFAPGMNAIMGPTGGGKTTLLDVIAGRTERYGISGQILVNARPPPDNFKFMTGYVIQDDVVVGTLTVRENLMFSANLRLPGSKSHQSKCRRVENTIKELGLTKCADTKVGTEFIRGVSGGERRRTNIGMELIIKPTILFLDEPTTGLDASTAAAVMSLLQSLSRRGRTVIFSIHQPRYAIFKSFDRLTLLAAGRTAYHGPAAEAVTYFSSIGYNCEEFNNPPDFFLDTINGDSTAIKQAKNEKKPSSAKNQAKHSNSSQDLQLQSDAKILPNGNDSHTVNIIEELPLSEQLAIKYRESEWFTRVTETLQPIMSDYEKSVQDKDNDTDHTSKQYYARNIFQQFNYVSRRIVLNLIRNPQTSILQTGISVFFGLIVGIIYLQLGFEYPAGLQDRVGALFFIAVNQLFSNMSGIELFVRERVFFIHENASGFYRVSTYFLAKVFCDFIPMRLIPLIAFSIISYFMIGLQMNAANFFIFFLDLFLTTLAGAAFVFTVSASVSILAVANLLCILVFILMMIFGGLFVNLASMPAWLSWLQYLSIVRYSFNALAINELEGEQFYTTTNGVQTVAMTGDAYLSAQGIAYQTAWDFWQNIMALGIIALGFLVIAYLQLLRMKKLK